MREKLLDKNYVEKHIVDIYSLEEYIPMIITGMFFGIDISTEARSQWSHTIRDNRHTIRDNRELRRSFSKQKVLCKRLDGVGLDGGSFLILELMVFLQLHPEFDDIIKDGDYLDELMWGIEEKYDIDVLDYTADYNDLEKLLELPCLNNK